MRAQDIKPDFQGVYRHRVTGKKAYLLRTDSRGFAPRVRLQMIDATASARDTIIDFNEFIEYWIHNSIPEGKTWHLTASVTTTARNGTGSA